MQQYVLVSNNVREHYKGAETGLYVPVTPDACFSHMTGSSWTSSLCAYLAGFGQFATLQANLTFLVGLDSEATPNKASSVELLSAGTFFVLFFFSKGTIMVGSFSFLSDMSGVLCCLHRWGKLFPAQRKKVLPCSQYQQCRI